MNGQDERESTGPDKEFKAGGVSAAIWCNEKDVNGKMIKSPSIRIQKSFFDKAAQEYRNTDYFFPSDLAVLVMPSPDRPRIRIVGSSIRVWGTLGSIW